MVVTEDVLEDVQAAAVRIINRAQWFLMSLPIATLIAPESRSRLDRYFEGSFVRRRGLVMSIEVSYVARQSQLALIVHLSEPS